ncbi:thioredoxin [Phlyctema vagabunda]|uniref:Thioredoxin n=1 Tax=Phlyctema vagabunda TaxID=108571 RepID=A0ABR4P423_9HELO
MSSTAHVGSAAEFKTLLGANTIVVTDFYADWCGPCKAIAPTFESLSMKHSKPKRVAFAKVNVDNQQQISQQYGVTALIAYSHSSMPTFLIFRSGSVIETIRGADVRKLTSAIESAVKLAGAAAPVYSSVGRTLGGAPSTRSSMTRPWNVKGFVDAIIAFFGLYLFSLFSFDAYAGAENSPFNIHRVPATPQAGKPAARTSAAAPVGKKLGTIADLNGGS